MHFLNLLGRFQSKKKIKCAGSQNHEPPNLLRTDKCLEFESKHFKNVLNTFGIKIYHIQNLEKSAIIKRLDRISNQKMRKQFEARNNKKWIDILQNFLDE